MKIVKEHILEGIRLAKNEWIKIPGFYEYIKNGNLEDFIKNWKLIDFNKDLQGYYNILMYSDIEQKYRLIRWYSQSNHTQHVLTCDKNSNNCINSFNHLKKYYSAQ